MSCCSAAPPQGCSAPPSQLWGAGTVWVGNVRLEFHSGWPRVPSQPLLVWGLRENVTQVGETQPQTPKIGLVGKFGGGGRHRGRDVSPEVNFLWK